MLSSHLSRHLKSCVHTPQHTQTLVKVKKQTLKKAYVYKIICLSECLLILSTRISACVESGLFFFVFFFILVARIDPICGQRKEK